MKLPYQILIKLFPGMECKITNLAEPSPPFPGYLLDKSTISHDGIRAFALWAMKARGFGFVASRLLSRDGLGIEPGPFLRHSITPRYCSNFQWF